MGHKYVYVSAVARQHADDFSRTEWPATHTDGYTETVIQTSLCSLLADPSGCFYMPIVTIAISCKPNVFHVDICPVKLSNTLYTVLGVSLLVGCKLQNLLGTATEDESRSAKISAEFRFCLHGSPNLT